MRVPQQAVYDFLKAYVAEPDKDMVWESEIILNKDKAIFRLVGKVNDKAVMTVYADKDGRILGLTLAGTDIPKTVLGYLPAKVKEYVKNNKPNAKIYSISNGFDGLYYLLFDDNSRLNFDKEGNILN